MAVVESDFENNILSVHKRREQKTDVLWLHVDGCLQGAHRSPHHTVRCSDAQQWARQEGEQAQLRTHTVSISSELPEEGTGNPSPHTLPFGSPALLHPLARGAALSSQSSKWHWFILGQDHCWVHPCMHKLINRLLQSPQARLRFPLQMYFCYKLWCAAVACKKWSYSKKWF